MSEIVKLSELNDDQKSQTIDVFIEGFYNTFKNITKDKKKIHRLLENSFDSDMTYVYLLENDVVGFMGLAYDQKRPIKLNQDTFIEVLGKGLGKRAHKAVSTAMEKPLTLDPEEIWIDYIATDPAHRSMGIGKKLIEYVRDNMGYKYIGLDVLSKNPRAKAFYEREGFKVLRVKTNLLVMLSGFGKQITMRMNVEG